MSKNKPMEMPKPQPKPQPKPKWYDEECVGL